MDNPSLDVEEGACRGVGTVNANNETAQLTRARYLFVVSRQHPYMYELLVERFQDDKNVEVILDRRAATQEPAEGYGASERRRRPRLPADDLNLRSHLIITRPADHSAGDGL